MKTILVSTENLQELFDLSLLVKEYKNKHPNYKFILFDTACLYGISSDKTLKYYSYFDDVVVAKNPYSRSFSSLSIFKKIILLLLNIILIKKTIRKNRIQTMITGVPLAIFRLTKILNQKIKYVAYIRGIIANDDDNSLSAKIYKKISFLTNKVSILYCDYMGIVSDINIQYFYKNGLEDRQLIKCGPLHLEYLKSHKQDSNLENKQTIIFATSAFSHHHLASLEKEQYNFLKDILCFLKNSDNKCDFILRIHPRDNKENYTKLINDYQIQTNEQNIEDFLISATANKILLSAVSTLNFEWEYMGGQSLFYSGNTIYSEHENFYKTLDILPLFKASEIFSYLEKKQNLNRMFSHNDGNIKYFIEKINV